MSELTPEFCRERRQAVGWSQTELAQMAKVVPVAIQKFEAHQGNLTESARLAVIAALRGAGLAFPVSPAPPLAQPNGNLTPGDCLRLRVTLGWTHDQLAKRAGGGIEAGTIAAYEGGQKISKDAQSRIGCALEGTGLVLTGAAPPPLNGVSPTFMALAVVFWLVLALLFAVAFR
jgi:DNA-binding XRE family transcriptional regulator